MVPFRRSLVVFLPLLTSCSSSDEALSQSPCSTKLYQVSGATTLDESAPASAVGCVDDQRLVRPFNRVDVVGDDLCPSTTSHEASPACKANSDCPSGTVCLCPLGAFENVLYSLADEATCIPAQCTSGKDCNGNSCGLSTDEYGIPDGLYCRSRADDCGSDDDCEPGAMCNHNGDRWACEGLIVPEG